MRPALAQVMANRYAAIKVAHPGEGRRKWQLRVLEEFWGSNPTRPVSGVSESDTIPESRISEFTQDDDPYDILLSDVAGGVVIRSDYSDEEAWQAFCAKLKEGEDELSGGGEDSAEPSSSTQDQQPTPSNADIQMGDGDESEESDDEQEGKLIKVIDPTLPEERAVFHNISNIRALRLLNDVDIRPAPALPSGTKRVSPPHRLVDFAGWQEIYTGVTVWIYDAQSNTDRSVRLVSAEGDVYGTASGDSWRAQVSHVYDLQFNMTFTGMKINFGGMDRWDYSERKRNMEEVNVFWL